MEEVCSLKLVIILLCFPALALCGTCQYSKYNRVFSCSGIIGQEEFLYQSFKHRKSIEQIYEVIITNSEYITIEQFPKFGSFFSLNDTKNYKCYTLTIRNSFVQHISDGAFREWNELITLDLSQNNLNDFEFVKTLPESIGLLILSQNKLKQINLTQLPNNNMRCLNLSKNKISSILPAKDKTHIDEFDLSYNKLTDFNETKLKVYVDFLNLNFNLLESIEIADSTYSVAIVGNNITSINSNNNFIEKFYANFIPRNIIYCKSFSVTNTYLGYLNEERQLNMGILSPYDIDFSRTNLSNISKNYFKNMNINRLNLSYNSLTILNEVLFFNTVIWKLDLSHSGIKNITKDVFFGNKNNGEFTLILSGNKLEEVVDICETIPTLGQLDLSLNYITNIKSNSFRNCKKLTGLDLSQNNITHIGPDDFKYTESLIGLELNKNKISFIDSEAFKNLNSLRILQLSNNLIENIEEYTFSNLKLFLLDLSNNRLKHLKTNTFVNLDVYNLNLQGNDIKYIKSKAFHNVYNLAILNLSNIGLTSLENDVFYDMNNLKIIDLSNNHLTILDNNTFRNIPLEQLDLSYNKLEEITTTFQNLTNLLILKISNNQLAILDNNTFRNLPLEQLDLSYNKLEEIRTTAFQNLPNLRILNISNCNINKLKPLAFLSIKNLESIDLRNNNLTGIQPNVFKKINVQNMYLNGLSQPVHLDKTVVITNLILQFNGVFEKRTISNINLKNIHLVNSQIDSMKNHCLLGNYNLTQLLITNSNISSVEPSALNGLFDILNLDASIIFKNIEKLEANIFEDLNSLKILKISDTKVNKINVETFSGLSSLEELYLDGNNLNYINTNTFAHFNSSLIVLDLSRNSITFLEEDLFKLFNLRKLFLNNNLLTSLSFKTFSYSTNLEELRLDSNSLSRLPPGIFEGLENLRSLNISGNVNLFQYPEQITTLLSLKNLRLLYLGDK
ncbi:unnamed protein product [Psylliodes chrysocephalus]|uniref:Chaoptin n=1 Tax=Psylliodes chrysocephalus TaxID=3402493 RepID=A0A9P0G6S5_9CUCU|nr:unnamed protein product [Psylliodes chrysocephala]